MPTIKQHTSCLPLSPTVDDDTMLFDRVYYTIGVSRVQNDHKNKHNCNQEQNKKT